MTRRQEASALVARCVATADREERASHFDAAIEALQEALAAAPRRADLWARSGFLRMQQKDYEASGAELDRAVSLDPRQRGMRARWNLVQGRFGAALEDLELAVRRRPRDLELRRRRGVALALKGDASAALAEAELLRRRAHPAAGWLKGYALMASGAYPEAARQFSLAEKKDRGRHAYAALANVMVWRSKMAHAARRTHSPRHIALCGLGVRWPDQVTLEAIDALADCDVVFCNLPGEEIVEFLGLFCKELRPFSFRLQQDVKRCVNLLVSEAGRGRKVGFATSGHALVFGPLAMAVIKRCVELGIAHRTVSSPSSLDFVLSQMSLSFGYSFGGVQLCSTAEILAPEFRVNPRLATLVDIDQRPVVWGRRLAQAMRRRFPARQEVWIFFPGGLQPEASSIGALSAQSERLANGCQIFVPALRASKRAFLSENTLKWSQVKRTPETAAGG